MKEDSKILITGAGGMVGKNLVRELNKEGHYSLLTPSSEDLDLRDRNLVFNYFNSNKPEYVFHLAARVGGIKANIENPVEFLRDNLLLNTNVIDASYNNGIKKLINLGSSCIYPTQSPQPMREEHLLSGKLEPTNEGYALSKILSLKLCQYYNEKKGTNFISLMPPNIYGVHDKFSESHSHVLAALLKKFHLANEKNDPSVKVWGTGEVKREFLYAEDMAKILTFSMKNISPDNLYERCFLNCGPSEEVSITELSRLTKKVVGFEGEILFDTSKPTGMKRKLMDSSRFKSKGFNEFTSLEEGLKKTYEWYKEDFK